MKYNLGCGFDYRQHWINIDRIAAVGPDLVHDLLVFPWPIPDDSADEVLLSHVIEELAWPACLDVFRELFRVAKPGCRVTIRFQDAAGTATPIRSVISPSFFDSLDLARCEAAIASGAPATPHALNLQVDFALQEVNKVLAEPWRTKLETGEISREQVAEAADAFNNVVAANEVTMTAIKPFRVGRWLRDFKGLVVQRAGGLGDVLMALSAIRAVKSIADIPVYLETDGAYVEFARLCPHVNGVFDRRHQVVARLAATSDKIKVVDWGAVLFGISHRHEVDAFLQTLGLFPPDAAKGLEIDLPPSEPLASIAARLGTLPPGTRVVLHPGITDPNRTWPPDFWQAIARHALDRDCAVIVIGRNGGEEGKGAAGIGEPGVLNFADSLDLAGTLHLLRHCDMLISGDAGPIQLAGASDIHIVGLYSVVAGGVRLPFRHGSRFHAATAIAPACDLSPCYSRLQDNSMLHRFCTEESIAPTNLPALFSRWCLNPTRYACVSEPGTLDRVKAEIDRLADAAVRDRPGPRAVRRPEDLLASV